MENVRVHYDEIRRWLIMDRRAVAVVCNFSDRTQRIALSGVADRRIRLASESGTALDGTALVLPGEAVAIVTDSRQGADAATAEPDRVHAPGGRAPGDPA